MRFPERGRRDAAREAAKVSLFCPRDVDRKLREEPRRWTHNLINYEDCNMNSSILGEMGKSVAMVVWVHKRELNKSMFNLIFKASCRKISKELKAIWRADCQLNLANWVSSQRRTISHFSEKNLILNNHNVETLAAKIVENMRKVPPNRKIPTLPTLNHSIQKAKLTCFDIAPEWEAKSSGLELPAAIIISGRVPAVSRSRMRIPPTLYGFRLGIPDQITTHCTR